MEINDDTFAEEVLKSALPVLVEFWAPWCMPCKLMAGIIDRVAQEYEGKIKVCKLNVDESPRTASDYGIMSIPTMIIFKGGSSIDEFVGAMPFDEIKAKIDRLLEF